MILELRGQSVASLDFELLIRIVLNLLSSFSNCNLNFFIEFSVWKKITWFVNNLKSGEFGEKCKKKQNCLDYPTYESQAAMKPGQRAQLHSTPCYNLESPIESVGGQIEKCDSQCTSPNLPLPLPTFFQEEFEISNHVREICGRNAQRAYQLPILNCQNLFSP